MGSRKLSILWICISCLLLFLSWLSFANTSGVTMVNVGVVIDPTTRIGKEQRVGIEVAAQEFNNGSNDIKISLHFGRSNVMNPLQAANSAMELIKENGVEAIVGSETWQETALLGEIGIQDKVPILSLATLPSTLTLSTNNQSSYLVKMTGNYDTSQISCIVSLVKYYQWKKVVTIYENDGYDRGISLMLDQLSQALEDVGSMIEYQLALPPITLMKNPKENITLELIKVLSTQSRVFVVLYSSLPLAIQLFKEAKNMGLVGRETVWIVTDSIANLIDSMNSSSISNLQGTLGIKIYFDEYSKSFNDFQKMFLLNFISKYPEEDDFHPGIHALRAYDAMTKITKSIKPTRTKSLSLEGILESNTSDLSGDMSMINGELNENERLFRIINIVGKSYKELDFWSSKLGFTKSIDNQIGETNASHCEVFHGKVNWPGDIDQIPKGWETPINAKPLKIGVPFFAPFEKFVKVENVSYLNKTIYSGFSIDLFLEVVKIIEESYALPFEFEAFYGTYDDLIENVHNKTYDAAVGDLTISANRSMKVEFSQPYTKSGLTMIVPLTSKESQKAWMFMKPFSWQLWLISIATMLYTVVIIWLLERRNNLDLRSSWRNQLGASLWFTATSIFFAHRENIRSNHTRMTMAVWLFVVFVLTSSYTASLTSLLIVPILEPKKIDIKRLVETNSKVGCDGAFVQDYLVSVFNFTKDNIKMVHSQYNYPEFFANGTIVAAFIERPYAQKVFLRQYCKTFTQTKDRLKMLLGFGFAFQKGSPLAVDVSKAILKLSENGILKALNDKWFTPSLECSSSMQSNHDVERLNIQEFWVLYLFSCIISTLCLLVFVVRLQISYRRYNQGLGTNNEDQSVWNRMVRLALYFDNVENITTPERPLVMVNFDATTTSSSDDMTTPSRTPDQTQPGDLEMSLSLTRVKSLGAANFDKS